MRNVVLGLAIGSMLAGCSGPMLTPVDFRSGYAPGELARDAGIAPVGVIARTAAGTASRAETASAVAAALPKTGPAAGKFAAMEAISPDPNHRLVFDFTPKLGQSAEALCKGDPGRGREDTPGAVAAALCVGASPLSWAVAYAREPLIPGSAVFTDTIRQLGSALMPSDNPSNRGEGHVRLDD